VAVGDLLAGVGAVRRGGDAEQGHVDRALDDVLDGAREAGRAEGVADVALLRAQRQGCEGGSTDNAGVKKPRYLVARHVARGDDRAARLGRVEGVRVGDDARAEEARFAEAAVLAHPVLEFEDAGALRALRAAVALERLGAEGVGVAPGPRLEQLRLFVGGGGVDVVLRERKQSRLQNWVSGWKGLVSSWELVSS
jgi:hypothetical protein